MLRFLFDQSPRAVAGGCLREASAAIAEYVQRVSNAERHKAKPDVRLIRLRVLAAGFDRSLDELEQSVHACEHFSRKVVSRYLEDMDDKEMQDYHRHVYFYKNALIRIFSTLDKLGGFLNEQMKLQTEKVKERYSYYTILRRMHDLKANEELERKLEELKAKYAEPMLRLREQRNMEIHALNEELADDIKWIPDRTGKSPVENIRMQVRDLEQGSEMVCLSLLAAFRSIKGV